MTQSLPGPLYYVFELICSSSVQKNQVTGLVCMPSSIYIIMHTCRVGLIPGVHNSCMQLGKFLKCQVSMNLFVCQRLAQISHKSPQQSKALQANLSSKTTKYTHGKLTPVSSLFLVPYSPLSLPFFPAVPSPLSFPPVTPPPPLPAVPHPAPFPPAFPPPVRSSSPSL